jgi:RNA polymerase sigma-70 factor (ECF subfamily)
MSPNAQAGSQNRSSWRSRREPFSAGKGFNTQVPPSSDLLTTDEARMLLQQACAGDGDAFCRLAAAHEQRLYRQAVALCGHLDTAEDLAAETLVEAWRSLSRYDGTCRFSTWLYAILLHRYQKLIRHLGSRPIALSSLPQAESERREGLLSQLPDPAPHALAELERYERVTRLRAAVAELPAGHRAVLLMRFFEGASVAEIAALLAIPPGTVKSRLHHGLARLREMGSVVNLFEEGRDS